MRPRFVGRLGLADAVTTLNAAVGFCAVVAVLATGRVGPGARLVLLAAIADGLDGVLARRFGSSPFGDQLDSLADVASFGVAPAVLAFAAVHDAGLPAWQRAAAVVVPAAFVAVAVVRLALYNGLDVDGDCTEGIQTTLAGTLLAAGLLAGAPAWIALAATGAFVYLMVVPVTYPDLLDRDAVAMGTLQAGAVLFPGAADAALPRLLLAAGLAYLLLAPRFYWRG